MLALVFASVKVLHQSKWGSTRELSLLYQVADLIPEADTCMFGLGLIYIEFSYLSHLFSFDD